MVKVLYIADMLHTKSGITSVIMNYYRHFDKSKVRIDFLLPEGSSEQRLLDEVSSCGSDVFFMPLLGASIKKISRFRAFIDSFFSSHNDYVAVHSHFMQLNSLVFPIAKRYGIGCTISHSHLTKYSEKWLHSVRNWFMCLPNNRVSDVWAACGVKAGEFLYGKKFLSSPKRLIVRNAIELDRFAFNEDVRNRVRSELGIDSSTILLGTVGRLQTQKNQLFLLDVMKALPLDYRLVVVGEGPLDASLKGRSRALGLGDRVVFLGRRNDVPELYQAFDAFLLPSIYEGLPVVGVEAQASGLPCLFSRGVTDEVGILNSRFIPIDKGVAPWVSAIEALELPVTSNRASALDSVRDAGFDIILESECLGGFYERLRAKRS